MPRYTILRAQGPDPPILCTFGTDSMKMLWARRLPTLAAHSLHLRKPILLLLVSCLPGDLFKADMASFSSLLCWYPFFKKIFLPWWHRRPGVKASAGPSWIAPKCCASVQKAELVTSRMFYRENEFKWNVLSKISSKSKPEVGSWGADTVLIFISHFP